MDLRREMEAEKGVGGAAGVAAVMRTLDRPLACVARGATWWALAVSAATAGRALAAVEETWLAALVCEEPGAGVEGLAGGLGDGGTRPANWVTGFAGGTSSLRGIFGVDGAGPSGARKTRMARAPATAMAAAGGRWLEGRAWRLPPPGRVGHVAPVGIASGLVTAMWLAVRRRSIHELVAPGGEAGGLLR